MALNPDHISKILEPYTANAESGSFDWPRICDQLAVYLDLLLKWNARMNLTAIREPEEIVRRHFGESLFAGLYLQDLQSFQCSTWNIPVTEAKNPQSQSDLRSPSGQDAAPDLASNSAPKSLLDFGSGAGFPGLPIQLLLPELAVTLAEARQKKASFLHEVVRSLGLKTEIWADRVESMLPSRRFDVVTMRAVDEMRLAIPAAASRESASQSRPS